LHLFLGVESANFKKEGDDDSFRTSSATELLSFKIPHTWFRNQVSTILFEEKIGIMADCLPDFVRTGKWSVVRYATLRCLSKYEKLDPPHHLAFSGHLLAHL
jgi:hypothetical protein